jgi:hypothetical protein
MRSESGGELEMMKGNIGKAGARAKVRLAESRDGMNVAQPGQQQTVAVGEKL